MSMPAQDMRASFQRSVASLKAGQYRQAREIVLASATMAFGTPADLVELGQRLLFFNLSQTMREVAARLLAAPLWHAGAESDFAALLTMTGEQAMAAQLLERAIGRNTPNPIQIYNRSQLHLYLGRLPEADSDLQRCLAREPGMAKAHWALSKLPSAGAGPDEVARLEQLAAQLPAGSQDEAYLRFALFNRLDRSGQDEGAWQQLSRGCQVKRGLVKYDAAASAGLVDALEAAFPVSGSFPVGARESAAPTPVFIVGMHRSGTTLLERILGNHSQVSEGGELYDFPAQLRLAVGRHFAGPTDAGVAAQAASIDFEEVGLGYLAQVQWRARGKPFLVDKLPSNFLNVGFIRQALPQARVIHMRRDPMDTCYSNFKELFSSACAYSYDQAELADYYALYRRLMAHWQRVAPGFVLDVSYEDLARDPQAEATRILEFCGLGWEPGCIDVAANSRAVNTASSAQVREPIHQRGIGAWRRHEAQLAPLAAGLAMHGIDWASQRAEGGL